MAAILSRGNNKRSLWWRNLCQGLLAQSEPYSLVSSKVMRSPSTRTLLTSRPPKIQVTRPITLWNFARNYGQTTARLTHLEWQHFEDVILKIFLFVKSLNIFVLRLKFPSLFLGSSRNRIIISLSSLTTKNWQAIFPTDDDLVSEFTRHQFVNGNKQAPLPLLKTYGKNASEQTWTGR